MRKYETWLVASLHIIGLVVVTYGSLSTRTMPPANEIGLLQIDALFHVGAYGLLGVTAGACLGSSPRMLWYLFLLALYGGGLELSQVSIPGRSGSWEDFIANTSGLCLSFAFVAAFMRYRGNGLRPVSGTGDTKQAGIQPFSR